MNIACFRSLLGFLSLAISFGCNVPTYSVSWNEVPRLADVEFGEPTRDSRHLVIPIEIQEKLQQSVYNFAMETVGVRGNQIRVGSRMYSTNNATPDRESTRVELPEPFLKEYELVNVNPNGTTTQLQTSKTPD